MLSYHKPNWTLILTCINGEYYQEWLTIFSDFLKVTVGDQNGGLYQKATLFLIISSDTKFTSTLPMLHAVFLYCCSSLESGAQRVTDIRSLISLYDTMVSWYSSMESGAQRVTDIRSLISLYDTMVSWCSSMESGAQRVTDIRSLISLYDTMVSWCSRHESGALRVTDIRSLISLYDTMVSWYSSLESGAQRVSDIRSLISQRLRPLHYNVSITEILQLFRTFASQKFSFLPSIILPGSDIFIIGKTPLKEEM